MWFGWVLRVCQWVDGFKDVDQVPLKVPWVVESGVKAVRLR